MATTATNVGITQKLLDDQNAEYKRLLVALGDQYTAPLVQSRDAQVNAQNASYSKLVGQLDSQLPSLENTYQQGAQGEYVKYMNTMRNLPQQLASAGIIGTGAAEGTLANMNNAYGANVNQLLRQRDQGVQTVNQAKTDAANSNVEALAKIEAAYQQARAEVLGQADSTAYSRAQDWGAQQLAVQQSAALAAASTGTGTGDDIIDDDPKDDPKGDPLNINPNGFNPAAYSQSSYNDLVIRANNGDRSAQEQLAVSPYNQGPSNPKASSASIDYAKPIGKPEAAAFTKSKSGLNAMRLFTKFAAAANTRTPYTVAQVSAFIKQENAKWLKNPNEGISDQDAQYLGRMYGINVH
jgi:hypothetical protein